MEREGALSIKGNFADTKIENMDISIFEPPKPVELANRTRQNDQYSPFTWEFQQVRVLES